MSRSVSTLLVALPLIGLSQVANSASWSIGSHMGLSTIRSERPGSGTSAVVAWPSSALTYQPGLRIALGSEVRHHELLVDTGLFFIDQAGSTLSLFTLTTSYQHTFSPRSGTAVFANLGGGLFREGGAAVSSTSSTFGAGLGVRHVVGDSHGAIRAELRVDRLHSADAFGRPALNLVGLRLGFDLWL